MTESMGHPETERLQELAAGRMDASDAAVVESHLSACERCRDEVEEWSAIFGLLSSTTDFAPSSGFAERVMTRVDVRVPLSVRISALVDRVLPRSTRGWTLAAAFMALPALIYLGAFAWLASRPWFSTGWLLTAARDGLIGGMTGAFSAAWDWTASRPLVQSALQTLAAAGTETIGLGLAVFGTATVVSAWVLYRHLIRTPSRDSGYATFAF